MIHDSNATFVDIIGVLAFFLGVFAPASQTWALIGILTVLLSIAVADDKEIRETLKFAPEVGGYTTIVILFASGILAAAIYHVGILVGTFF